MEWNVGLPHGSILLKMRTHIGHYPVFPTVNPIFFVCIQVREGVLPYAALNYHSVTN